MNRTLMSCIQEHRIYHDDIELKYHDMKKGWVMITSSAEKATNNSTIRGVGLLLSPKAHKALNSVETINPRILIATFIGNPAVTVISCYSPTNVSNVDGREEFYAELSELTKAVPKHSVLLIGGDMNGKIGASDAKGSVYNKHTNENGQLLLNYVLECNLKPLNTSFKKREGKLWTHTSPSGAKCQIDYILINNKWKNSALNCEAYNTFCSVGSDHRIVTAKTRLSLRQSKPSGKKFEYRMSSLQTFEFRTSFFQAFQYRISSLQTFEFRISSLRIFDFRISSLQTFGFRMPSVQTYEFRMSFFQTFEHRMLSFQTFQNRMSLLQTFKFGMYLLKQFNSISTTSKI